MASTFDARQALTAMAVVLTAYTSATAVSTATFATSIASQQSADTGLTAAEKLIGTAISSGIGSATPSSFIHGDLSFSIDAKTLMGAMTSVLTAFSSASGVTTGNFATQLSSVITADTGLSAVESTLVTMLTNAVGSSTPSATIHTNANCVADARQILTWFSDSMRALCLTHASGTTTDASQLVTSVASQLSADTGLTTQEKTIATAISSAINSATPSSGIHSMTIG